MNFYSVLRKLQFRIGKYAPNNLIMYIIGGMTLVFVADLALSMTIGFNLSGFFMFNRSLILSGQLWRVLTFIFMPPNAQLLFMVFALYFYYLIGTTLEREWGSYWFCVYYVFGVIGTIIAGFIAGAATNYYLNMSLFFAFAVMHPNFQLLLFFIVPVKIKWLAYLDGLLFLISFITGSWADRAAIIASLINFLVFFGPSLLKGMGESIANRRRRAKFNREYGKGSRDRDKW